MLSNTATPKYYGEFREKVLRNEIPVCKEISMEMNRIDALIANPGIYYDDEAIDGFIEYCENKLKECHNIKWTVQTDKTPAKNEIEWFD